MVTFPCFSPYRKITKGENRNLINTKNNPSLLLFLALLFKQPAFTQEQVKVWLGHSYRTNILDELSIGVGQLYLFDEEMTLSSMQHNVKVEYQFNGNLKVGLGYVLSSDPSDPDQEARNRIDPRIRYRFKIGDLRVTNQLRTEWHFPSRSKFEYRFRYSLGLHAGDFGLPLDITPYITNELHYYLNGRPLNYRDGDGDIIVSQPPNGLHAYRFQIGVRLDPFKRARISLLYMSQKEFNIGSKFREINVVDPRDGDILREFNNFSVVSFSFSYRIKIK